MPLLAGWQPVDRLLLEACCGSWLADSWMAGWLVGWLLLNWVFGVLQK